MPERSILIKVGVKDETAAVGSLNRIGEKGEKGLKRIAKGAKPANKELKLLDKNAKGASDTIGNLGTSIALLDGPLGGVSSRFAIFTSSIGRIGVAGATGIGVLAGLTAGFVLTTNAAGDAEERLNRVDAILRATSNSSGLLAGEIDKLSIELGAATLTSRNLAREASAILLTFKSISGDTFARALSLSQDLADTFGGDLRSQATQLGKALEDPILGLTQLRRVGVDFTNQQRDMIRTLVESGQKFEAQRIILDNLETQVGGAGAGAAQGLAGAADNLAEAWTGLLETMGNTGPATDALNVITKILNKVESFIGEGIDPRQRLRDEIERLNNFLQLDVGFSPEKLQEFREEIVRLEGELKGFDFGDVEQKAFALSGADAQRQRLIADEILGIETDLNKQIGALRKNTAATIRAEGDAALAVIEGLRLPGVDDAQIDRLKGLREELTQSLLAQLPTPPETAEEKAAKRAEEAAKKRIEANDKVIESLAFEADQLSRNDAEQKLNAELRRLSADATGGQILAVRFHADRLREEEEAAEASEKAQDALNNIRDAGAELTERLLAPMDKFNLELERANELLAAGAINEETFNARKAELLDTLRDLDPTLSTLADVNAEVAASFTDIVTNVDNLTDALGSLENKLLDILDTALIEEPLTDALNDVVDDLFDDGGLFDDLLGSFSKSASDITGGLGPGGGGGDIASQTAGTGFLGFLETGFSALASLFHGGGSGRGGPGRAISVPAGALPLPNFDSGSLPGLRPHEMLSIIDDREIVLNPSQSAALRGGGRDRRGGGDLMVAGNLIGNINVPAGTDPGATSQQILETVQEALAIAEERA
jgi:hypothetical protein